MKFIYIIFALLFTNSVFAQDFYCFETHSKIGEICVVVVRYFGGTKLGTGGLARAYGEAVKQVVLKLETQLKVEMKTVFLKGGYELENEIRTAIGMVGGCIINATYTEGVRLECSIPKEEEAILHLPYSVSVEDKSSI